MLGGEGDGRGKNLRWSELLLAAPILWSCTIGEHSCFVAATLIATPRGPLPIGSLRTGDTVWSYDPTQGLVERRVEAVHRARANVVCRVEVGGALLRGVTPSHPMYDAAAERYRELRDLDTASRLLVFRDDVSRACSIERIEIQEAPEPVFEVYNLTVEGPLHNYLADGVLVHNKSPSPPPFRVMPCGNAVIDPAETCDDGNQSDGDGCSALCRREPVPPPDHCHKGLSFEDPVLERVVRSAVGVTEGELTLERIGRIELLAAYDEPITNLAGLECFTQLRGLDIVRGRVEDLTPLSGLAGLDALDISDNEVSDLEPLAGLTRLSTLEAAKNQIKDLSPLASLPLLGRLTLSDNQISELAPLRLLPIRLLVLNDNPLAGIEALADLPSLVHLAIDHTAESELTALIPLENLSVLSAVGNRISDLSALETLRNLSDLRFQDNLITDLAPLVRASGISNMDRVFLRGNPIDCAAQAANLDALRASSVFVDLECE